MNLAPVGHQRLGMSDTCEKKPVTQCKTCPWKVDCVPDEDIPDGYSQKMHVNLRKTIATGTLSLADMLRGGDVNVMACHYSKPGAETHCAGWLHNQMGVGVAALAALDHNLALAWARLVRDPREHTHAPRRRLRNLHSLPQPRSPTMTTKILGLLFRPTAGLVRHNTLGDQPIIGAIEPIELAGGDDLMDALNRVLNTDDVEMVTLDPRLHAHLWADELATQRELPPPPNRQFDFRDINGLRHPRWYTTHGNVVLLGTNLDRRASRTPTVMEILRVLDLTVQLGPPFDLDATVLRTLSVVATTGAVTEHVPKCATVIGQLRAWGFPDCDQTRSSAGTHPTVAAFLAALPVGALPNNAPEFRARIERALTSAGWTLSTEIEVADRGDGRRGFVDLAASKDGQTVFVEMDAATPREKSIVKLRQCAGPRVILLRSGDPTAIKTHPRPDGIDTVVELPVEA